MASSKKTEKSKPLKNKVDTSKKNTNKNVKKKDTKKISSTNDKKNKKTDKKVSVEAKKQVTKKLNTPTKNKGMLGKLFKKKNSEKSENKSVEKTKPENSSEDNKENTTENKNENTIIKEEIKEVIYDNEKVFKLREERIFLDGFLTPIAKDTLIKRTGDTTYQFAFFNPDGSLVNGKPVDVNYAEGRTPEEAKSICDDLYIELIQLELEYQKLDGKEPVDAKSIQDKYEGLPLTEVNLQEIAKTLPEAKPSKLNENKAANSPKQGFNPFINQMKDYSESILANIKSNFRVRIQGGMPLSEIKDDLTRCSKEYNYEVKHEAGKGYYIDMEREGNVVRIPYNENEYLPVK